MGLWPVLIWIAGLMTSAGSLLAIFILLPLELVEQHAGWLAFLILTGFACAVVMALLIFVNRMNCGVGLANISPDFWFAAAFAASLQLLLVFGSIQIAIKLASRLGNDSIGHALFYAMGGMALVGLFQLVGAAFFAHTKRQVNPIQRVAVAAVFLVTLMIIAPPIGGALAAYAVQAPLSGGNRCVVLAWSSISGSDVDVLRDEKSPGASKPLEILLDEGDRYQVRLKGRSEGARFVPRASVSGFDHCPRKN